MHWVKECTQKPFKVQKTPSLTLAKTPLKVASLRLLFFEEGACCSDKKYLFGQS